MSVVHYRRHSCNQEDDWEKRRRAAVKRLNKFNTGGKQTQPQPWTLTYRLIGDAYMLPWTTMPHSKQVTDTCILRHLFNTILSSQ